MIKIFRYFIILCFANLLHAQKIKVDSGSIESLANVKRYQVVFTYASDLKIKGYDSEEDFLKFQSERMEQKVAGSGEEFKKRWVENRTDLYEPSFIQEFNGFLIENKHVTVARNIRQANYIMLVKTEAVDSGYDDLFYVEEGGLDVSITFFESETPEHILYAISTKVRGNANADDFERIRTSYGNLGLAISKHLNRKALVKN